MSDQHDIPLLALFIRALRTGSKATNLPTVEDETQDLVASALSDLEALANRVQSLGLFSPNETLEDLTARDMVYLFVPFVQSELEGRVRTSDPADRIVRLRTAQKLLEHFSRTLDQYDVIPDEDKALWSMTAAADASRRRENKIKQYKHEKSIRATMDGLRASRGQATVEGSTDLDDIMALLPSSSAEPSDADDDGARKVTVLCLRFMWGKAQAQLESTQKELELLRSMPPPPPPGLKQVEESDATWRLDQSAAPRSQGPLLDSKGKPLRPFTILPAGVASDRQRLLSEVFRPDHRLPTMTIDEYLEEENRRGNIVTGGGPASLEQPTTSEQLAMDSEMDGTFFGEEKSEAKRQKDENWARWTDTHPKGAGNTMNRG